MYCSVLSSFEGVILYLLAKYSSGGNELGLLLRAISVLNPLYTLATARNRSLSSLSRVNVINPSLAGAESKALSALNGAASFLIAASSSVPNLLAAVLNPEEL